MDGLLKIIIVVLGDFPLARERLTGRLVLVYEYCRHCRFPKEVTMGVPVVSAVQDGSELRVPFQCQFPQSRSASHPQHDSGSVPLNK